MQNHIDRLDHVFPMAATVALDLVQRGEIRDQWLLPSALPKMSIGALTCHLGRQVIRAAELLPVVTDVPPLESVDARYHRAAWVVSASRPVCGDQCTDPQRTHPGDIRLLSDRAADRSDR